MKEKDKNILSQMAKKVISQQQQPVTLGEMPHPAPQPQMNPTPAPPQVPQNKNSNLRPEQLQAASILIQAAKAAFNKGGVYSMDDVVYIKQAIDVFTVPQK